MAILTALHHSTFYQYDRHIGMGPQTIRLRPAPHCRTPIHSYSLTISPKAHFLNWQQDPFGNFVGRVVFTEPVDHFRVDIDLIAEMTVINPFDFFIEPDAEMYPFAYEAALKADLLPFLEKEPAGPLLTELVNSIDRTPRKTIDFVVDLNQRIHQEMEYEIRMEPGVQTPEESLTLRRGSCRDSAWLLVQTLRNLGFAARFASGYIIQLKPDVKSLDGPSGTEIDFTDLHAWAEVFLPGAGWIGLDATSGLLAGEGHIPLACTPSPISAAPIDGGHEACEKVDFSFSMNVSRFWEDPRVTKPYTEEEWEKIYALGGEVDQRLDQADVKMTMGGEPTFVSIDDMEGEEWTTAAVGPTKRRLADDLMRRLFNRFSPGGLLHYGLGKWYPGEPLPRWAFRCYWREDGQPIWENPELFAVDHVDYGHTADVAKEFGVILAEKIEVNPQHVSFAYEDAFYYAWRERRMPANVDPYDSKLEDKEERLRMARIFEQGLTSPVGVILPLQFAHWEPTPRWISGEWVVRSEELFLVPGDSPMGLRLPLDSLIWETKNERSILFPLDPLAERTSLMSHEELVARHSGIEMLTGASQAPIYARTHSNGGLGGVRTGQAMHGQSLGSGRSPSAGGGNGHGSTWDSATYDSSIIRTALCIEAREGRLHVFCPPLDRIEAYLDLMTAIEQTAKELNVPVVIEGYLPPHDDRINSFSVTPDPGVIEVNIQPAHNWDQLVDITTGVYEDAHYSRLGTEKFNQDGRHTGTGGGNHVVIGGPTPGDSPFLKRPDLLRSLVAYWHNHPSLSYLFSGSFIGPTSQAPRVDEGRRDAIYELKIAFEQIPENGECPPWMVDRIFRNLLVDMTGNTHRSEFCIDKLFSPDSSSGRRGLLEFRAFEMPPHARMSLTQQLLLRSLVCRFLEDPYRTPLVDWDTTLHDRFMLPYFVWQDFEDVILETNQHAFDIKAEWFAPHFEFKFPKIGHFTQRGVNIELRTAIEPWYVLGEEQGAAATARYVDSSIERLQVRVDGMTPERYMITCNGRKVPLHPTGVQGQFAAGVRYRAWQPPSCLHPTIPVDEPLTFDLFDIWQQRSLGGCRYFVGHPGGNNPESFPVNAFEAESRRAARFHQMGHTAGKMPMPQDEPNSDFPFTLDLRRGKTVRK
ncbi:transglutaminase family protein [Blastopirellula sp. J2-11]|uniref:transglutaminase family protein n=1 Tax=Blastopirellula sp. J2-11 TaxID=2943192 RepID=UPI0021C9193F|nr:transglutaminase family protein [Blastopirellula sp. J2-11]UUO08323.1 transglutaminase family protein [Blastopirellula sp. J2-11]